MSNSDGTMSCTVGCWLVAVLGGSVGAVILMLLGEWTVLQAAFAGLVIAAIAGLLLSWLICQPLPKLGEVGPVDPADTPLARARAKHESTGAAPAAAAAAATGTAAAAPPAPTPDPAPAPEAAPDADRAAHAATDTAAVDADAGSDDAAADAPADIKPSSTLAGEEELAARKGEWKYEKPAGKGAAAAKPEPAPAPTPAPAAATADAGVDPVAEAAAAVPAGEEKKPETLSAARAGGPDDLKMIKGVGPKLEALLHSLGFFHFDQVASWKAEEVAWVDQNLKGFKGRVSRDKWVAQAKILAEGGTTEFSSKAKKGGVYD
ncbi:MAG: endonuclease [Pseudomonadota bacterium]